MRVLVVEDEPSALCFFVFVLATGGFEVLQAQSGAEALEISRQFQGAIHLLLSDIMMPGMSGIQLAQQLRQERPGIKIMLMSGYNQGWEVDPEWGFLPKPFSCEALLSKIHQLLSDGVSRHGQSD